MSVSKPTMSPARIRRSPHSWNHGLVRSARREQAALDPLAAVGDVGLVQDAPELVLGDAGLERGTDALDREVADRHRRAQAAQLLGRLDHPRLLDRRLHADELDPARQEAGGRLRVAAVHGEPTVAASVPLDQPRDLLGPPQRLLADARAGEEVGEGRAGALLVDRVEIPADVPAARELEQHHRPLGRDERVAAAVVHGPDGHVAAAGGVAQVDRVGEQGARDVAAAQLGAKALEAARPQLRSVDLADPVRHRPIERHDRPRLGDRRHAAPLDDAAAVRRPAARGGVHPRLPEAAGQCPCA